MPEFHLDLEIEALADEVFGVVEHDQGKGFVSDGLGACRSREDFFNVVRGHYHHSRVAVKKLAAFLRKYGELQ